MPYKACNVHLFRAVVLLLDLFDREQVEGIVPSNHNQAKCVDGNHLGEDKCCLFDHREGDTCSWNADGGPASRIYNTGHNESTLS